MRVLMISKALVIGAYQKKCEELAKFPDIELRVVVPPLWKEGKQKINLEPRYTEGYTLVKRHMVMNGHFHLHFYPGLIKDLHEFKPDIVHLDEEAYNIATAHGLWLSKRYKAKTLFFTWQNIYRELPFPFNKIEKYCLNGTDYALAGNKAAAEILIQKGFRKPIAIIPQFGVDPYIYSRENANKIDIPRLNQFIKSDTFVIGYIGRLVPQKGLISLLEAVSELSGKWHLVFLGDGPLRPKIEELARLKNISDKVSLFPAVSSVEIPSYLAKMNVLVLPSLTTSNWKEQFGRVLIEAMACEVPVIGSDSGEIPYVIDKAGLVFPEGNYLELRKSLEKLIREPEIRKQLAKAGRERILEKYTQEKIALATYKVYKEILS